MAAAEREHAEPGEEVEVAPAVAVEEVRALGAHVVGVEPDRAQHARHLRVHVALVQRERLVPARLEQRAHVEGAAARSAPASTGGSATRRRRGARRHDSACAARRRSRSRLGAHVDLGAELAVAANAFHL